MISSIDASSLVNLMGSDAPHAVLDIRSREDFVAAQILGSTTVPLAQLEERITALVPVPSLPTIIVAGTDAEGSAAASAMRRVDKGGGVRRIGAPRRGRRDHSVAREADTTDESWTAQICVL